MRLYNSTSCTPVTVSTASRRNRSPPNFYLPLAPFKIDESHIKEKNVIVGRGTAVKFNNPNNDRGRILPNDSPPKQHQPSILFPSITSTNEQQDYKPWRLAKRSSHDIESESQTSSSTLSTNTTLRNRQILPSIYQQQPYGIKTPFPKNASNSWSVTRNYDIHRRMQHNSRTTQNTRSIEEPTKCPFKILRLGSNYLSSERNRSLRKYSDGKDSRILEQDSIEGYKRSIKRRNAEETQSNVSEFTDYEMDSSAEFSMTESSDSSSTWRDSEFDFDEGSMVGSVDSSLHQNQIKRKLSSNSNKQASGKNRKKETVAANEIPQERSRTQNYRRIITIKPRNSYQRDIIWTPTKEESERTGILSFSSHSRVPTSPVGHVVHQKATKNLIDYSKYSFMLISGHKLASVQVRMQEDGVEPSIIHLLSLAADESRR